MSHDKLNYRDIDAIGDAMHFLRHPLDCEEFGLTVVDCPPGWTGKEHDHAEDGQEEVYLLVEGSARVSVEGNEVGLAPGDALRVDPDATRQLRNGDGESQIVIVGAP